MAENHKYLLYTTEMLTDIHRGIYTKTYYWSDGTTTQEFVPKGIISMPIVGWL